MEITNYLDLFFENHRKYYKYVILLKRLIISEIYYRYKLKLRLRTVDIDQTNKKFENYIKSIPLKDYSIRIIIDDFNLSITKLHDLVDEKDEIRLNLDYRRFMSSIFDKDFKYNMDLKDYIQKNREEELKMTIPYLENEIKKISQKKDEYNLDENMENRDYLKYLKATKKFYYQAIKEQELTN